MSIRKNEDPRSVRSKNMFKQAARSLLIEEPSFSQVTVQKVADRAELNRATFYLHYEDINDLIMKVTNEIFDDLSIKLEPLVQSEVLDNEDDLTQFLDYIYDNRKLFAVLFEHKRYESRLFNLFKNLIETRRDKAQIRRGLPERLVSTEILTSSIIGIIMWWIRDGIHFSSEHIANQISMIYRKSPIS
ncbi:TetR-like C-terminal domain-containing protein [Paenibacillus sp. ACRRY]|uniref:TetR/AcrR family transcriptional regulator n=1 Tax=Paenibacillus sp. ACRRY TaxID=2918208 RepID=UPI001EF6A255|nr:TetR-like C-terminal domain-containing protein [Paenibacillus sp. ACRRY]MCG7381903.1 TetR family transcriptional regulator C-terminal domain-containing protein [Paenibacillus sp. ACRRY]